MRVVIPRHRSRAIARIGAALEAYAPYEVKRIDPMRNDTPRDWLIPGEDRGDLVVLPINGLRDHWEALAARAVARGQRYAVVQIALRTTRFPKTDSWRSLWRGAAVVWSYYPLDLWIAEEGGPPVDFNFYHAPLGADAALFEAGNGHRPYTVFISGRQRNQEGVAECDEAAFDLGGRVLQLGPTFAMKSDTTFVKDVEDSELPHLYQQCQFVSGLRRTEGFELPAAEGLLCGARPVLFDQPHYRCWYEPWGHFVREQRLEDVRQSLVRVFERGPLPVTRQEREAAAYLFGWERICRGFWEACGHA